MANTIEPQTKNELHWFLNKIKGEIGSVKSIEIMDSILDKIVVEFKNDKTALRDFLSVSDRLLVLGYYLSGFEEEEGRGPMAVYNRIE